MENKPKRTGWLVSIGDYYTDGRPFFFADTKKEAIKYMRSLGFTYSQKTNMLDNKKKREWAEIKSFYVLK
jgi:hypothetical protein